MLTVAINGMAQMRVSNGALNFGLVTAQPERQLCSCMFECRDYMNDYLSWVSKGRNLTGNNSDSLTWLANVNVDPDFDKLRLLMGCKKDNDLKERIFFAKKILNILEKEMGVSTSKITSVKIKTTNPKVELENTQWFLVTGPAEWMLYSQTLSFVTFIFKSCFFTKNDIINKHKEIKSLKDVKEYFADVLEINKNNTYNSPYVSNYIKLFLDTIDFFIKDFNKIFLPGKVEERFIKTETSVHSSWGIMHLFSGNAIGNKNLLIRYNAARDNYKKEKE